MFTIRYDEAIQTTRLIMQKESILTGILLKAARGVARRQQLI
ncbi:MAG: hypothetical protein ACTS73_08095 [Arsenophonus sp. NEOnobi-MAG3]